MSTSTSFSITQRPFNKALGSVMWHSTCRPKQQCLSFVGEHGAPNPPSGVSSGSADGSLLTHTFSL